MKKESAVPLAGLSRLLDLYPPEIGPALANLARQTGMEIFLVGGTVRDYLLGLAPGDLDLAVTCDAAACCRHLIGTLGGGAFVDLGGTGEDVARVVYRGLTIDIAGFRGDSQTIVEDLRQRDYTVNAMAVPFSALSGGSGQIPLLDPLGGLGDLGRGELRCCPGAFIADPLRMLRGFRLAATLGFSLCPETLVEIGRNAEYIGQPAAERINHELDLIMESNRAFSTLKAMHGTGLLCRIVPELCAGVGVQQPEFHHLDVFHHSLQALAEIEEIIEQPDRYYPSCGDELRRYLEKAAVRRCLKWAALLHDIGKPVTREIQKDGQGRVTFYGHDEAGRNIFEDFAERLKWSNEDRERTGGLIAMHMHPFHLCNVQRIEPLSKRAILKLCRRAGDDLCGLFLLAMADSLASRGEKKPEEMEAELADLLRLVLGVYERDIRPVVSGPPLLNGRDLIETLHLQPGPIFSVILRELEALRVEGEINSRDEALAWVTIFMQDKS
jgi:poly(A) polymerase